MAGTCEAGVARFAALGVAGRAGALPAAAVGVAVVRRGAGLFAVGAPLVLGAFGRALPAALGQEPGVAGRAFNLRGPIGLVFILEHSG